MQISRVVMAHSFAGAVTMVQHKVYPTIQLYSSICVQYNDFKKCCFSGQYTPRKALHSFLFDPAREDAFFVKCIPSDIGIHIRLPYLGTRLRIDL